MDFSLQEWKNFCSLCIPFRSLHTRSWSLHPTIQDWIWKWRYKKATFGLPIHIGSLLNLAGFWAVTWKIPFKRIALPLQILFEKRTLDFYVLLIIENFQKLDWRSTCALKNGLEIRNARSWSAIFHITAFGRYFIMQVQVFFRVFKSRS